MKGLSITGFSRPELASAASEEGARFADRRRGGSRRPGRVWQIVVRPFHRSIYVRFQYAFALAALGLALMAVITIVSNRALLQTYENSVAEARLELMPVHHLQVSLREMDHLLYHYAIERDQSALPRIKELQATIIHHFHKLADSEQRFASVEHAHSRISIAGIFRAWQNAQAAIGDVLKRPIGTTGAREAVTRVHVVIDPIYDMISEFHRLSMQDLQERLRHAQTIAGQTYYAMLGAIFVGLGVLIIIGLIVGRSILHPIAELQGAAHKLARQDFSYRVKLRNTRDELGQLGRAFNIAFEALQRLYRELEKRSTHDGLTGALNRAAFDDRLQAECKSVDRHERPLSLLMVDIDFFKRVNDNYGHQTGDQVLQAVAGLLNDSIRAADVVARYGGEEFAVILPDTDEASAVVMAERLRRVVEETPINCGDRTEIAITVSIGCVTRWRNVMPCDELVKAADTALYRAKETGRNRVVAASELASTCSENRETVAA